MSQGSADDTIVGVATGTPDGGVAVVRISGSRAGDIAGQLVRSVPPARMLVRREVRLGPQGEGRETALVVVMPGPASYTGEDVVELHIHAGERNVRRVVERIVALGATGAGPGDFTRRAFANGRVTLDQAEGIAALIGARTDAALLQARRLAAGEVGRMVIGLAKRIGDVRTELEAHLDFPDDVHGDVVARWTAELEHVAAEIDGWLAGFEASRRARERARFVLAGPTNAGKSALFNALLGRRRALVSDRPGTTRDYVEADLELGPHVAVLVDTAGVRRSTDAIELAGIALSREQVEGADVLLWVEGADAPTGEARLEAKEVTAKIIRIEAKCDLGRSRADWLGVSARTGTGIDELSQRLQAWFGGDDPVAWVGLARHRDRADDGVLAVREAITELVSPPALELAAFQLRVAETRLGEILGRSELGPVGQDVLDRIFARFCIGK